jgi:tRNA threonylcarbamoyl adenosine modification protein YeaZ
MMQLAIDTSTEYAGLALMREGDALAEMNWRCGLNHTVELYPHVDFLMKSAQAEMKDLDCIIVARGPGSFNGLRVGVSAAKGLALNLNIPIIGIGTLEYTAYQHAETGLPVCALQNAGREEIAAALYQLKPRKGWTQLQADYLTTPALLAAAIKETTIICGEIKPAILLQLKKMLKSKAVIPSSSAQIRRAVFLAELGLQRRAAGQFDNLATLQPVYLRRPPITERRKPVQEELWKPGLKLN